MQGLKAYFWGTRGSLPVSLTASAVRAKIIAALQSSRKQIFGSDAEIAAYIDCNLPFSVSGTYGGNTSCVELKGEKERIICDAGTGIRELGNSVRMLNEGPGVFNIFLSHLHWDHIQGFPFFAPAYVQGNRINLFGFHKDLENAFPKLQEAPFFPVPMKSMKAEITFSVLDPEKEYEIGGFRVRGIAQNHPGTSYGYRFERRGKTIVYSTDSEYLGKDVLKPGHAHVEFCRDADLLIFDAQYIFSESVDNKENWGHSSNILGIELAITAGIRKVALFHHDPGYDDSMLDSLLEDARHYVDIYSPSRKVQVDLAYDGLEISV